MGVEILVREAQRLSICSGPPFEDGQPETKLQTNTSKTATFSQDGFRLMVLRSDSEISVYDCQNTSYSLLRTISVPSFTAAAISPRGTYLQTFQDKSVVLWHVLSGDSLLRHSQKNITKTNWPSIRFSSNEDVACRLATNEIHFFDVGDFSKGIVSRLRVPGIAALELSNVPASHVAAFVPEIKGVPASIQIFKCGQDPQNQPVARKSFFRSSSVQLNWNRGSTGLLVVVQSDVDKTNQSYYGESKLNYLTTDGSYEGLVPLRKDGPVHDVQWSYSGSEFAVVYGFMPAKATVFNKKCVPLLELGEGPYNTIRWNPKGKFLCLAGFGNLPGHMAFWDYEEKKQLATTKAELSVTSEWSPDGCYFMTATTAPRLQVDNGIKIFHYNGSLCYTKMFDRLYQADWKPESPDRYGDITELVKAIGTLKVEHTKPLGVVAAKAIQTSAPAAKPGAYRPPHVKNATSVQAELFGQGPSETLSKSALKNKKKREKQREKKAAEGAHNDS